MPPTLERHMTVANELNHEKRMHEKKHLNHLHHGHPGEVHGYLPAGVMSHLKKHPSRSVQET
jgi:hypothetical protein